MSRDVNLVETVELLDNVGAEAAPNQRALARRIGISVGLLNALVHRAVAKGLIKIREAPTRRYAYYLTPRGFAEKSRLVAEYLDTSLTFFRTARQDFADVFARCEAAGLKRVVLCGAGELAEIASLAAHDSGITVVAVFDRETNSETAAGLPVVRELTLETDAAVVISSPRRAQETYDRLAADIPAARLFAPGFLRISRGGAVHGERR